MDSDRFYHEVDREARELADINGELQIAADELIQESIDVAYSAFLQDMFALADVEDLELDDQPYTVTGCDQAEYNDGWYDDQFELETL